MVAAGRILPTQRARAAELWRSRAIGGLGGGSHYLCMFGSEVVPATYVRSAPARSEVRGPHSFNDELLSPAVRGTPAFSVDHSGADGWVRDYKEHEGASHGAAEKRSPPARRETPRRPPSP